MRDPRRPIGERLLDGNISMSNLPDLGTDIIDSTGQVILSSNCSESCATSGNSTQNNDHRNSVNIPLAESDASPCASHEDTKRQTLARKRQGVCSSSASEAGDAFDLQVKRCKRDSSLCVCDGERQDDQNRVGSTALPCSTLHSQNLFLSKPTGSAKDRSNKQILQTVPQPQLVPSVHLTKSEKEEWLFLVELSDALVQGTSLLEDLVGMALPAE